MPWNLSYRFFGPTTVHLKHEIYLLISLAILQYASIGDLRFTALVTLWLSRCLVLRWLLTAHDTLTSLSERSLPFMEKYNRFQFGLFENVIDVVSTVVLAGQTFDRPDPHIVAKFVGTNHIAADMMVENDLGAVLHGSGSSSRNNHRRGAGHGHHNHSNSSSYNGSGGLGFWEWCETTFYKLKELCPSSLAMASSEAYWTNLLRSFGPSSQLLLQLTTVCFLVLCWIYPLSEDGGGFVRYFSTMYQDVVQAFRDIYNISANRNVMFYNYGFHDTAAGPFMNNHALIMEALSESGPAMGYSGEITIDNTKTFGMYQHSFIPTWIDLSYYIILCGTCLGLFLYGRVMLPVTDLVAGSNVLSSFKEGTATSGGGGSGKSRGGNHKGGGGAGNASGGTNIGGGDTNSERPWLEQCQSIITEQRLKLVLKVAFARVVENVFLIVVLSRTDLACKTTGQCPNKSGLKELAKVMFHAGITAPLRSDTEAYQMENGKRPFSVGENPFKPDLLCATVIAISVVVVTLSLLLAQAATLNRSRLGINGYLAGGWIAATTETVSIPSPNKNNSHHHKSHGKSLKPSGHKKSPESLLHNRQPAEWVPRKRYKKGDTISFEGSLYKATTNNPEGKPYDFYTWLTHKIFRNELGHPATSRLIALVTYVQFGVVSTLIILILSIELLTPGGSSSTYIYTLEANPLAMTTTTTPCLLWTLAANIVAVYGTVSVAIPDYSELGALAKEITNE